jgi:DNA-binding GntR family transcriptional regulator
MASIQLIKGLREQIIERLRGDILTGRLAEGTPLRETELSAQFGVSRGPIRESLQLLTHEGLLVAERNRGVRVAPQAPDSIRELVVPIRRTIETFALRLFFEEIHDEDFKAWDEILGCLKDACRRKDYATIAEQDIALHRSFLERAGQPDLMTIWLALVARVRHHFHATHLGYDDAMNIHAEHRALIDTFRRGDLEAAIKELEENIG